jgi:prepilin-type N-terminal cleavage/methylation domain-containing protein
MQRHSIRGSKQGFTLIELIIILVILGLLAAVAIPRYVDLRAQAIRATSKATLDAGRAAITLDFASKIVNTGAYTTVFSGTGDVASGSANLTALEGLMEGRPNYPGGGGPTPGAYCTTAGGTSADCFHWYVVDVGSASPPRPARISATLGNGTIAQDVNDL